MNAIKVVAVYFLSGAVLFGIDLPTDSVSYGIFESFFDSTAVEGGIIRSYFPCPEVNVEALPLVIQHQPAVDEGFTVVTFPCTGDTIFYSTQYWMGVDMGSIFVPATITPADSFVLGTGTPPLPDSVAIWGSDPGIVLENSTLLAEANLFLDNLNAYAFMDEFGEAGSGSYQVLIWIWDPMGGCYPDSLGIKWIALVCRNPLYGGTDDFTPVLPQTFRIDRVFPNPFNAQFSVEITLPAGSAVAFKLVNLVGQEVARYDLDMVPQGTTCHRLDGSALESGSYFLQLIADGRPIETVKIVNIK